jgi:ribose transport system substrate-binding protein
LLITKEYRQISTKKSSTAKNSTTFERRQRLLSLLHDQPGIRVKDSARLLHVSEGTIRNDLNALANEGHLQRVRGGGVPTDDHPAHSAAFAARFRIKETAKRQIARWAAELVEDRDTILFDASTTVYHMAQLLKDRRGLTIITNGIEVGRKLAQESSHTVMLLGGVLSSDGVPVTDLVSDQFLKDLHIKTAFVSCAGFTPEAGLTERDIRSAQIKSKMIAAASSVVALIDSSKFGQAYLAPFARADQIGHIFTDSNLDPHWIGDLRSACPNLTLCNDDSVTNYTPCAAETRHYQIAFANLGENMPFSVDVRHGIERAAQTAGNIDLILADNQLNGRVALQVADHLLAKKPDLVIEYQIDEQVGRRIMEKFQQANVPVIAIDIPMVGATYFGVNHYQAGHVAGEGLGKWIKNHWNGHLDWLTILAEPRAGALPASRIQGQLDGLQSVIGHVPAERQVTLNSGNTSSISDAAMADALKRIPNAHRIAVICFNDGATIGALTAARRLHREQDVAIVGQGADRRVHEELERPGSRIIGSTAYMPERYGEQLIPLALRILRGEPVPPAVYIEHQFISAPSESTPATSVSPAKEYVQ